MLHTSHCQSLGFDILTNFASDGNTLSHLFKWNATQKTNTVAETQSDAARGTANAKEPART